MMTPNNLELISQLAVSWALFGLIWTVQLSHYPGFAYVSEEQWSGFHTHHRQSITLIVMPLMLIELGLACWFVFQYGWSWSFPLVLVIAIWLNTFFVAIPLHSQLEQQKDIILIQQLVSINWWRTLLWTLKAGWVSWLFWRLF